MLIIYIGRKAIKCRAISIVNRCDLKGISKGIIMILSQTFLLYNFDYIQCSDIVFNVPIFPAFDLAVMIKFPRIKTGTIQEGYTMAMLYMADRSVAATEFLSNGTQERSLAVFDYNGKWVPWIAKFFFLRGYVSCSN